MRLSLSLITSPNLQGPKRVLYYYAEAVIDRCFEKKLFQKIDLESSTTDYNFLKLQTLSLKLYK